MKKNVKDQVFKEYKNVERPLFFYTILSFVCLALDLVFALVMLIYTDNEVPGSIGYFAMLLIVTLYFYADLWLLFYALRTLFLFDSPLHASAVFKAILGLGSMFEEVYTGVSRVQS